ncbi:hypothetical protein ACFX15_039546 [Malus domestica]
MRLKKAITSSLEDVIKKARGCAVVDGGCSTQLERHGAAINNHLWSAVCLIKQPDLIKRVHVDYLEAGTDILITSSYQLNLKSLQVLNSFIQNNDDVHFIPIRYNPSQRRHHLLHFLAFHFTVAATAATNARRQFK